MVNCDISIARSKVSDEVWKSAIAKAETAYQQVIKRSGPGSEWLGWQDLLAQPNDAELEQLSALAAAIRADADVFIVCGIGGSYLGAKAVIDALSSYFPQKGPEIIYAGHHMSGKYLQQLIDHLRRPKADGSPKNIYLNVISKSGSTLETALSFRMLRACLEEMYGDESSQKIVCTTSKSGGILNKLIDEKGYKKFIIPDTVGGRFSVLTPVGLLPIAVAGIDIRTLFYGAVSAFQKYEGNPAEIVEYAALRFALHNSDTAVDIFASFEPELASFGGWIQQLLGESEGKEGKGIFPAVASFSTDLHSLGQFIQQGSRNLMETFISVKKQISTLQVNNISGNDDQLNYLSGKSFHEVNAKAEEGTIEANKVGDVPIVQIQLDALNAESIGQLIYFFELLTAVYVYCLDINPFDQPGVEDYKKAMYRLLGKE